MKREATGLRLAACATALAASGCSEGVKEFLFGPSDTPAPPAQTASVPVPSPSPVAPLPTPTPYPTPRPDTGEDIPDNDSPVAKVGAKVFFIECDNVPIPGSENASEAQVGCRLHMDCTAKDAANNPTRAQGAPHWYLSDPRLVSGGRLSGDYTPTFIIQQEGTLTLYVVIDSVRSNDVTIRFHR
jgi:hypothetical protein